MHIVLKQKIWPHPAVTPSQVVLLMLTHYMIHSVLTRYMVHSVLTRYIIHSVLTRRAQFWCRHATYYVYTMFILCVYYVYRSTRPRSMSAEWGPTGT